MVPQHKRMIPRVEIDWFKRAVEGILVEQLNENGIVVDVQNPSSKLTIKTETLNKILNEFYVPIIGERGCALDPNNISFKTLKDYLLIKVEYDTFLADVEANEQDAYL